MYEQTGSYFIVCYWDGFNCGGQLAKVYYSKAWAIKRAKELLTRSWCKKVRVLEMPVLRWSGCEPNWFDDVALRKSVFEEVA